MKVWIREAARLGYLTKVKVSQIYKWFGLFILLTTFSWNGKITGTVYFLLRSFLNSSNINYLGMTRTLSKSDTPLHSKQLFNIHTSESCKMLRSSECKSWNPSFIPRGSFRKHVTWSQHWHTKPWHWWILRWQIWGLWMFA